MGAPLDAIDTLELAELLDFTADALSWREAHIVHPDLQAHLRRWARRLGPDTREWNWASPAPPAPGERAASAVPGPDTDSPDRPGEPDELDDRRCQLSLPPGGIDQPKPPSCHDAVTMICPVDQRPFTPIGRQKYCRDACRAAAYRRAVTPAGRPSSSPRLSPAARSRSTNVTAAATAPSANKGARPARPSCAGSASEDAVQPVKSPSPSQSYWKGPSRDDRTVHRPGQPRRHRRSSRRAQRRPGRRLGR